MMQKMFRLNKQAFTGSLCFSRTLASIVNISNFEKCISLKISRTWQDPLLLI